MKHCSFAQQLFAVTLALLWVVAGIGVLGPERAAIAVPQEIEGVPMSAKFVPADAPVMVSLMGKSAQFPDPLQETFGTPLSQTLAAQVIRLPQNLLSSADIDYQDDLQPWIADEVTFALADAVQNPGYLLAVVTSNTRESQALLDHLWQKQVARGRQLRFEQYKGVSLIATDITTDVASSSQPSVQPSVVGLSAPSLKSVFKPFTTLATAMIEDRYVLVTNGAEVLRTVIDTVQSPQQELTHFADYENAVNALQQKQSWGFAFINLSTLLTPFALEGQTSARPYRSVAVALDTQRDGILVETVLVADPDRPGPSIEPTVTDSIQAVNYIPRNSPFVLAGVDLGHLWTQISHDLMANAAMKRWVTHFLTQQGNRWGINFSEDIFPFVEGEYAIAMLPHQMVTESPGETYLQPEWLFVNAVPSEASADDAQHPLDQRLDHLVKQQQVGVNPFSLEGQSVSAWTQVVNQSEQSGGATVLSAKVMGAFATLEDHKILATSLGALRQSLTARSQPLAQQQNFQAAIAPFAVPNQGYLYLDWPTLRPLLEQQLPQLKSLGQTAPTFFKRLQSLTVSNYGETPQIQRSQLFFRLAAP